MDAGAGLLILGGIIVMAVRSSFSPRKRSSPSTSSGFISLYLRARENTRAKRKLAEDKEKRAEKRKVKEHRALMRAEGRLEGKGSWWW